MTTYNPKFRLIISTISVLPMYSATRTAAFASETHFCGGYAKNAVVDSSNLTTRRRPIHAARNSSVRSYPWRVCRLISAEMRKQAVGSFLSRIAMCRGVTSQSVYVVRRCGARASSKSHTSGVPNAAAEWRMVWPDLERSWSTSGWFLMRS